MSELILHHYDLSPYAEKIRLAFGLKGLAWRSVQAPMVMPKPDHVELTGGYRRVPVLQVGADVYCDTHCITRVLDRLYPERPLSPKGQGTIEHGLSRWAETTFMLVINAYFGIGGVFDEEFVEDRRKTMLPPGVNLEAASAILPTKLVQIRANLDRLELLLGDGRSFLLGDDPGLSDLSAFHPVMMLGLHELTGSLLGPVPRVRSWMERVGEIGHGDRSELDSSEAIAIARSAEPAALEGEPVVPDGMKLGDPVMVLADEFGSGNVLGALAPSELHEIAVRRQTERAGEVVVHFPREDYSIIATG
jgi:glutathione S-transferase